MELSKQSECLYFFFSVFFFFLNAFKSDLVFVFCFLVFGPTLQHVGS